MDKFRWYPKVGGRFGVIEKGLNRRYTRGAPFVCTDIYRQGKGYRRVVTAVDADGNVRIFGSWEFNFFIAD